MDEPKLPKGHLSYSQLVQFADCPAYWKAVNLDGRDPVATARMRVGAAVHDLISRHLVGMSGEEAQVTAAHELSPAQAAEAMDLFERWAGRWGDSAQAAAPEQVEDLLEFDVPTEPPVRFQARLDFWRREGDTPVIYDWKTSARLATDGELADIGAELWSQLLTYALALCRARCAAQRCALRLVYLRYGVVHEQVVNSDLLDRQERALVASSQSVLLGLQAGQFRRRPGRACAACPLRRDCDLSMAPEDPPGLAQAWLWHRERARELEEMLRGLADDATVPLCEHSGVEVGYRQENINRTVTRTVDRRRQILGLTESGEEVWVEPVTKRKPVARFGVWERPGRAVLPAV